MYAILLECVIIFFFFKQKTAYEMSLRDWSSDVCSSDPSRRRHTRCRYVTGVLVCRLLLGSEEHTSELQSRNDISYAVFCLKKKKLNDRERLIQSFMALMLKAMDAMDSRGKLTVRSRVNPERLDFIFFFFNDTATTEIYTSLHTLSLHDALPI